jgi:lipoyl(octanoyl) transferase
MSSESLPLSEAEWVKKSLDTCSSGRSQKFLDFAPNDRRENTTKCLFCSLQVYHDVLPHSTAMNMSIDEALLEHATVPSIRFYRWRSPALSFGYFGRFSDVANHASARDLVRRWTGGGIVFHGDDLTYSIVIPANDKAFESSMSIYDKVHHALVNALNGIGKHAVVAGGVDVGGIAAAKRTAISTSGYNCFANPVRADVMIDARKVAGAAHRRTRRGLLQQGSIQGVELENGFAERFAQGLSASCSEREVDRKILNRARELAQCKYETDAWLRKR